MRTKAWRAVRLWWLPVVCLAVGWWATLLTGPTHLVFFVGVALLTLGFVLVRQTARSNRDPSRPVLPRAGVDAQTMRNSPSPSTPTTLPQHS